MAGRLRGGAGLGVIPVEEHVRRILDAVAPLPPVELAVDEAQDCVLAEDVGSPLDLPGFDNSAMDGYAVKVADVAGADRRSPVTLPVVGDIPAGDTERHELARGQALRIMTGAPMPEGAEAVVQVENTDHGVVDVAIYAPVAPGQHVRRSGGDVRQGQLVLEADTVIGPAQVALLFAVGRRRVRVHPRPRVAVISTGTELVHGRLPGFGEVIDSNGPMLAACARDAGAAVSRVEAVPDDPQAVLAALTERLAHADALITTGGVSAGAYDTVKEVLSRLGTVRFDKVAMQPGMPQGFGTLGEGSTPIFTLPGNPVSSFVSFEVFVRPALRKLAGHHGLFRRTEHAVAVEEWTAPAGKTQFARAVVGLDGEGRRTVRTIGPQGSHVLGGLAHANCLAVVPEDVTQVRVGDLVRCLLLERGRR
jgi:molybdopterin molybdotransferase